MGEQALDQLRDRGRAAFGQQRRDRHRDRKMDREQQAERHGAGIAIGLQDHRHADEDGVRLGGGEAGDDELRPLPREEPGGDDHGQRPDHGEAGEIGDPVAPGLGDRDIGLRERAEQQAGHGEDEDEIRQALAGCLAQELAPAGAVTEADQPEDGQDDEEGSEHGFGTRAKEERLPPRCPLAGVLSSSQGGAEVVTPCRHALSAVARASRQPSRSGRGSRHAGA